MSREATELAVTFAALGDSRRISLIDKLYHAEALSVSELCSGMDVSRQAVSKHLRILADAQLVLSRKAGREVLYSLEKQKLSAANAFLKHVDQKWDNAFDRLKTHLEN